MNLINTLIIQSYLAPVWDVTEGRDCKRGPAKEGS